MKRVFGIFTLTVLCILLGLSVRWSRERGVSLISPPTALTGDTV